MRKLTTNEKVIQKASSFLGMQEISGIEDNPKIVGMFKEIGFSWVKNDETAWCSCFVNYIAKRLNLPYSGKLNARSWLGIGEKTIDPKPGDVVVFWRESRDSWKGHVGFFMGYSHSGDIFCLGGNQKNEVNITLYSKDRLLSFIKLI